MGEPAGLQHREAHGGQSIIFGQELGFQSQVPEEVWAQSRNIPLRINLGWVLQKTMVKI